MMNDTPDNLLVKFIQTKDPEDFEPLVRGHLAMIHRVIHRIVLNEHDTEDLVQETFICAFQKIDTFQGRSKFSTWLCTIAVHLAISFQRKKRALSIEDIPSAVLAAQTEGDALHSEEEMCRIHQTIGGLSVKLRAVVVLHIIEGMNLSEVALVLKCPTATVYWRLHQARKILAKKLEARDE